MGKRFFGLTIVLIMLLGGALICAAQESSDDEVISKVNGYRRDASNLVRQQGLSGWASWVEGQASDQSSLYDSYSHLFTEAAIEDTRKAISLTQDQTQKKALSFFKAYQEIEYIGKQTAVLSDIYMDLEAGLWVNIEGESVKYRELYRLLSQQPNREKRELYAAEEYKTYQILNSVVLGRYLQQGHKLAKELAYRDYADLAVAYRMFDAKQLSRLCERFLVDSEQLYLSLFDKISPVPRTEFRRSDTLYLLGGRQFDDYFPQDKLIPRMDELLLGLGIDRHHQQNLLVDDRSLPAKVPRAVCFAIDVPGDIRLSIKPVGGKEDYSSLFHEMGHGQHFANAKTPVWEFQQLGSNAVTETYAYLFEYLTENPTWIGDNTDMDEKTRQQYADHCAFSKLYMVRRYMAKFLYELKLHSGEKDPQKLYQDLMSKGYGYQLNEQEASRYLSDVDPFLYAADYVQAFFLEAQLTAKLEADFGRRWWTNPEAGIFLKELFAYGNELTGRKLGRKLGYTDGFESQVLVDNIHSQLGY